MSLQVAKILSTYGVETILCLPKGDGNAADFAKKAGVEVRRIVFERVPRPRDMQRVLRWFAFLPRDVQHFVALSRHEQPDVVHVNAAIFIAPAIAAKLMKIPLVWHLNDAAVPAGGIILGPLVRLMADQIVATSEVVAVHYNVAQTPYELIYPPVDTKGYSAAIQMREKCKHRVSRIGLIANWHSNKDVELFVQSAALVRERLGGELEIVFAGAKLTNHADYCRRVNDLIRKLGLTHCICDYGFVPDVVDVLANLDVLIMSSITESGPMVVLEGMAAGVPVVATDVGAARKMLLGDSTRPAGIVVPPKDVEAMAAAILDLWKFPDKAVRMGENGRQIAEERFSLEKCAQRHLKVYRDVASRLAR